jgi:hypothetical protein
MDEEPAIACRMQQRFKWLHGLHCRRCAGFQNYFEQCTHAGRGMNLLTVSIMKAAESKGFPVTRNEILLLP